MTLTENVRERIEKLISSDPVVLFMKGTREQPQCGFSAQVIEILDDVLPAYKTFNVLSDVNIREGIKEFSSWPTIPQLYIRGEFVGGCDIVNELARSGELHKMFGVSVPVVTSPKVSMTASAKEAFMGAIEDAEEGDMIRLKISARYDHAMSLDQKSEGDVVVIADGITILMDPMSASRADGISFDYEKTAMGGGFQIDNPNAVPPVKEITPKELKEKLDSGTSIHFFDVRTEEERSIAQIASATPFSQMTPEKMDTLAKDSLIVLHCHHGGRSMRAAEQLRAKGFRNVHNLTGGIDAWSKDVDNNVPRY